LNGEKKRVLFWLEDHYYHFGIAKSLQDLYDCEIFSIISSSPNAKKFYQEQKLVKSKKSWFLRDSINLNNKDYDISFLQNFEKKYDIPIWKLVSGERFFNIFSRYHQFTRNEILSIIEQEIKFFEKILTEVNPDFLIIRVPEFHDIDLLYRMCVKLKIKPLILDSTRFGYRWLINSKPDPVIDFKTSPIPEKLKNFEQLRDHVTKYATQHNFVISNRRNSKKGFFKAGLNFLLSHDNMDFRNYYQNIKKTKFNVFLKESHLLKLRSKRKSYIDKNFLKSINNETPFVFFPLHFEPEQTLLIKSPYFTNQIEVITNIAKSLPVGFTLVVKEHPAMQLSGWRKISDYEKISNLPNVVLLHPSVSNEDIIPKSSLVITISGTSGLEAAFHNKPSIIFTDVNFSNLSSVYRLQNWHDLPCIIDTALNTTVDLSELNQFVNYVESISFSFDVWELDLESDDLFSFGGFIAGPNISVEKMTQFLENNKLSFELLANEHIKKIENSS
jgi:hypothetical protein